MGDPPVVVYGPADGAVPELSVARGVTVIDIEDDLWKDDRKNIVPLQTDLSKLRPHYGSHPRTKESDRIRYNELEDKIEEQYAPRHTLPKEKRTAVRTHADVNKFCDEMTGEIDKYTKEEFIFCGLDTEKGGCTVQTSIHLSHDDGREYERHILFQMKTLDDGRPHVLKEGLPVAMKKFFLNSRLVFMGKNIRSEIKEVAEQFKIDNAARDLMKFIELEELYTFSFNLCKSPARALRFINADQTNASAVKPYWPCVGQVGLKAVARLAWPDKRLRKLSKHRNHRNNFDEWRGPITEAEMEYAILDAVISRGAGLRIADFILSLHAKYFVRGYGTDALLLDSLQRILSAADVGLGSLSLLPEDRSVADAGLGSPSLSPEEQSALMRLNIRRRDLGGYVDEVLYTQRRYWKKGSWARAILAYEREDRPFKVRRVSYESILWSIPLPQYCDYQLPETPKSKPVKKYMPGEAIDVGDWGDWGDEALSSKVVPSEAPASAYATDMPDVEEPTGVSDNESEEEDIIDSAGIIKTGYVSAAASTAAFMMTFTVAATAHLH